MKTSIIKIVIVVLTVLALVGVSEARNNFAKARYFPVTEFLEEDAVLSQWYEQYVKTTTGDTSFNDFLKRLSESEVLSLRGKKAGLTHNQIFSPIVTLINKDWMNLNQMSEGERSTARLAMLELDIALAAVESTLPAEAHEEFRREVIRGAKPLTEMAKTPGAIDVMRYTLSGHDLSDRINKPTVKTPPAPMKQPPPSKPYFPDAYTNW